MCTKKKMPNSVDNNLKTSYQVFSNTTSLADLKNNLAVPAIGYQSTAVISCFGGSKFEYY